MGKMDRMKFIIGAAFLMCFSFQGKAQIGKYISVDEAVEAAMKNNGRVKASELDQKVANANYRQTDAVFLPQVDMTYTALTTNNPLNAFGFLLQHQSVSTVDFDPAKLNYPNASQDYSAKVEFKLPLLNLDMAYVRKGAKAQEEVYKHKAQRTKEYTEFEVRKAYAQLQFSYQAREILRLSLADVQQIYESANNFYNQGLAQKSDVLNAQVQVNTIESALAKAESNIHNASDGLRLLIGMEVGGEVFVADSLTQKTILPQTDIISEKRSDILALAKAVDASSMMVKSAKMAFLPRINAFGAYQYNDAKPLKFGSDSYLIGINMTWSIFSGNQNKNKLRSYQFQRDRMEEELNLQIKQGQLELNKAKRDLNDIQIEINKQQASIEQAKEALRITSNRYKEGLMNTTDLLMAQAQLSKQRLLLAQAILSYNINQDYLGFIAK
jgi:outer membrane protein TolC